LRRLNNDWAEDIPCLHFFNTKNSLTTYPKMSHCCFSLRQIHRYDPRCSLVRRRDVSALRDAAGSPGGLAADTKKGGAHLDAAPIRKALERPEKSAVGYRAMAI
jgi:hypothetical protein